MNWDDDLDKELWLKKLFFAVNPVVERDKIVCWFASSENLRKRFRIDNYPNTTLDEFKTLVEISFL